MTDKLLEKIKADREVGTPGPWRIKDCESYGDRCKTFFKEIWNDETDILVTTEVTRAHNDGGTVNMRRIARVPDIEDRIEALEAKLTKAEAAIHRIAPYLSASLSELGCGPDYIEACNQIFDFDVNAALRDTGKKGE